MCIFKKRKSTFFERKVSEYQHQIDSYFNVWHKILSVKRKADNLWNHHNRQTTNPLLPSSTLHSILQAYKSNMQLWFSIS